MAARSRSAASPWAGCDRRVGAEQRAFAHGRDFNHRNQVLSTVVLDSASMEVSCATARIRNPLTW